MSLCLLARFKNERHIMYEFIHHYLEEGVDFMILIDNDSDDDYLEFNKSWLQPLIKKGRVLIVKNPNDGQGPAYNKHLDLVKLYHWLIVVDMDEFMFCVQKNKSLKQLLNNNLYMYDYIRICWKIFNHTDTYQPKSVIDNNTMTHYKNDKSTQNVLGGIKNIGKTKFLSKIKVHQFLFYREPMTLRLFNCHNKIIQNNHYRTQSLEYLLGVKEIRGAGCSQNKYKDFFNNKRYKKNKYRKHCDLLKIKRRSLIKTINKNPQIKPKIYTTSSFNPT